jgi:hypothetical protein
MAPVSWDNAGAAGTLDPREHSNRYFWNTNAQPTLSSTPSRAVAPEEADRGDELRAHADKAGTGGGADPQPLEPAPQILVGETEFRRAGRH